jgi:hypothetical protein
VHSGPEPWQAGRVQVSSVDPRDQAWEAPQPKYRVYFHDADGTPSEFEVGDADVDEVVQWAEATHGDRTFVLYVCVNHDGLGLVRLLGRDPNEN